jgi:hypothetical protein
VPVWAWSVTSGRTRRGVCLVPQAARGTLLQSPIFPGADGQKAQIPSSIIITIAHRQSRCTSIHHPASPDSTSALIPHSLIAYLSCILVVSCLVWSAARAVPGRIRGVSSCSSSDCSYIGGFLQHPLLTLLLAYIYTYIYIYTRTHSFPRRGFLGKSCHRNQSLRPSSIIVQGLLFCVPLPTRRRRKAFHH